MKSLTLVYILLLVTHCCFAQHVYQIRADTVRIYNATDTAELILENHTKDTAGLLFNKGKGVTEFHRVRLATFGANQLAIQGQDTISINVPALPNNQLKDFYTNAATSSLPVRTYEDLYTYSIPAGKLAAIGDKITAFYAGGIAAASDTRRYLAIAIASVQPFFEMTVSTNTAGWQSDVLFERTGNDAGRLTFSLNRDLDKIAIQTIDLSGLDFDSAIPIKLRAAGGTLPGSVTAKLGTIKYEPGADSIPPDTPPANPCVWPQKWD